MGSGSPDPALARVFLALQLTGCAVFVFMLITALVFRSTIKRSPVWYNFCLSFVTFSLSYSLLLFTGEKSDPAQPILGTGVCIGQAALVYGAPFLASSAFAVLVALLLLEILSAAAVQSRKTPLVALVVALAFPWMLWVGAMTGAIVVTLRDVSVLALSPNGAYCVVNHPVFLRTGAATAAFFTLLALALEIGVAYRIYRHRRQGLGVLRQSIPMAARIATLTVVALAAVV